MLSFYCYGDHRDLHSFPTRRSSDLSRAPWRPWWPAKSRLTTSNSYGDITPAWRPFPIRATSRPSAPGTESFTTFSRSEEHTSELQSRRDLVCRLLLEKKNRPVVLQY